MDFVEKTRQRMLEHAERWRDLDEALS